MFDSLLKKIIGSRNDRQLKKMLPLVEAINALEHDLKGKSDQELAAFTPGFKQRLAQAVIDLVRARMV